LFALRKKERMLLPVSSNEAAGRVHISISAKAAATMVGSFMAG